MSGNYLRLLNADIVLFNKINNSVIRSANIYSSILSERKLAVLGILSDFDKRPEDLPQSKYLDKLSWCSRNERRLLDVLLPNLNSATTFFNKYFSSAMHHWSDESRHAHFFDKYFNNTKEKRAAKRLLSQVPLVQKLLFLFSNSLSKIESRLHQEELFLKKPAFNNLGSLVSIWKDEIKLMDDFERYFSDLQELLVDINVFKRFNFVFSSVVAGLTFYTISLPPEDPKVMTEPGSFFYWLFALAASSIAVYNLILLFRPHLSDEKKDIKLLKRIKK